MKTFWDRMEGEFLIVAVVLVAIALMVLLPDKSGKTDVPQGLVTNLAGEIDPELTARVVDKYGEAFIQGGIDFIADPNDCSTEAIVIAVDVSRTMNAFELPCDPNEMLTIDGKAL